jgi:hypothetical protein
MSENVGASISRNPKGLHGLYGDNFTFFYLLDTMSDCVRKVEKRARKPWITQEMISKMDERRK